MFLNTKMTEKMSEGPNSSYSTIKERFLISKNSLFLVSILKLPAAKLGIMKIFMFLFQTFVWHQSKLEILKRVFRKILVSKENIL